VPLDASPEPSDPPDMTPNADPSLAQTPVAARAGADLRAARGRLGCSVSDFAADLRIRPCHLEALEAGHLSQLPGNAYAVAYIRSYARALGLDQDEMVRRFKAEAAEVGGRPKLTFPVPLPDRGLPAGAVVLLGLVLSIAAYAGWYRLSADGHLPAEAVTEVPERLAPLAEQALPAVAPVTAVAANSAAPNRPAAADGRSDARRIASSEPAVPAPMTSPTSAVAAPVPNPIPDEVMAPAVPGAAGAAMSTESRIVLRASADAWMQVKDRSGTILLNRTMKAGEVWPVTPHGSLLLTTGNAGGTEILLDGAATPSLGASGTVRRDMPLDPDLIKDGKLAAALAPQLGPSRPRQ
jgi:cytoskeleton protein RodZ